MNAGSLGHGSEIWILLVRENVLDLFCDDGPGCKSCDSSTVGGGDCFPNLSHLEDIWNQGVLHLSEKELNLGSIYWFPFRKPLLKRSGSGM